MVYNKFAFMHLAAGQGCQQCNSTTCRVCCSCCCILPSSSSVTHWTAGQAAQRAGPGCQHSGGDWPAILDSPIVALIQVYLKCILHAGDVQVCLSLS